MSSIMCIDDFINECGITVNSHTSGVYPELIGFKYSESTVFSSNWNDVSLRSRGIAFNRETGDVIAHPFDKFFNYEELKCENSRIKGLLESQKSKKFHPTISGEFRVMDKLDGSLGIAFFWKGKWIVKTAGSFVSSEAIWATAFLNNSCIRTDKMNPEYTYCFEIIWIDDPFVHPLTHVYAKNDMVLIGVILTATGEELGTKELKSEAESINSTISTIYEFTDFNDVYSFAKELPNDKEGVVVTFGSGFKVKIKGYEFLKIQKMFHNMIQKMFHNITPVAIIESISGGKVSIKGMIPEEMPDMRKFADTAEAAYKNTYDLCLGVAEKIKAMPRKDGYVIAAKNGRLCSTILRMAYGGNIFFDRVFIDLAKEKYKRDGEL